MRKVAIGLLGPTLDSAKGPKRWGMWRPTVSICQHENLLINRFELLYQRKFTNLAKLVIDDIQSVSPETEIVSHLIDINDAWDFEEVYSVLHDFCKNYHFDTDNEEYLVHITTGTHVAQICMFLLVESHYFPAKLLQTSPPSRKSDEKTPGTYAIIDLDLSKYDKIATRFRQEAKDDISFLKSGIDTKNRDFNALIAQIEKVAVRSQEPILLTGPTGSGKSLLARRIYELKKIRRQVEKDFVEVNCATLRGDSAMSSLFGHKKGSFTGAMRDRDGLLCAADGGIIFLDEVGELGPDEQAMLLRAIEEKTFLPFGSDEPVKSNFQLICGTNRDLREDVVAGRFREDLLSRINLWTFCLPGLKDRREDIEPNIIFELERYAEKNGTAITFNKEAWERFLSFAKSAESLWIANFRDLNGAITRMATLAMGGRITVEIVEDEICRLRNAWNVSTVSSGRTILLEVMKQADIESLDLFDRFQLSEVIRVCRESKSMSEAGRKLFAVSRQGKKQTNDADRLKKYLSRFNLSWNNILSD